MRLTATIVAVCVIGAAGQALAEPQNATPRPVASNATPARVAQEAPWFQRFTFGSGYSSDANGWSSAAVQNDASGMRVTTEGKRWGVSLAVKDKKDWAPLDQASAREKVSAGAFYNLTPRVRFGGEMTLETRNTTDAFSGRTDVAPGVKLESAFRF